MRIVFVGEKTVAVELTSPVTVADAARKADLMINIPCGGGGRCGKCKVRVTGNVSEPTDTERTLLTPSELSSGVRLSCHTVVTGDVTVYLDFSELMIETSGENVISQPDTYALDIGTTTLALRYTDADGCVHTVSSANPQLAYGADVMSRISYALEHGYKSLTDSVRAAVGTLKEKAGVSDKAHGVTVGNTVMLSLYAGVDPTPIGTYPYTPTELFGDERNGEYIPLCLSGYIGADVLSAALTSGFSSCERALLCDIGTNGEIIYKNGDRYTAVSAAAGPALEGGGISSGMRAETGAIDSVKLVDGKPVCHVIGGGGPRGICGGGLIDAVACLITLGVIDETGYMDGKYDLGGVMLTPADVRAFQLAKGAIRAAIETVTDGEDADCVYISGGFGSGINVDSAVRTGLLPERYKDRIKYIGNGALSGAAMMSHKSARDEYEQILSHASVKELMTDPNFMENYMKYMGF